MSDSRMGEALPLLYHRLYNPTIKKYCPPQWEILHYRPSNTTTTATITNTMILLELGGLLTIYPNLIEKQVRDTTTTTSVDQLYSKIPTIHPSLHSRFIAVLVIFHHHQKRNTVLPPPQRRWINSPCLDNTVFVLRMNHVLIVYCI